MIVIDECHRSAWGKWHAILESNRDAIQIGLTATPRQLKLPDVKDAETRRTIEEERRRLADNYAYFGEPAYEYDYLQGVEDGYLAPADIEQYDIFHDEQIDPERLRGVLKADAADKTLTNEITGQAVEAEELHERYQGAALEQQLVLPERIQAMCAHLFDRLLKTGDDDPHQKTIIFCASDHHADLVANEMNNLYAHWCEQHGKPRVHTYAFKCMSSVNGQEIIPDFRGRQRSHLIATTKDLLSTGVNVPCVRNIVFFRYLQSPILFLQMVGRGTRIDAANGKLMFRIFDYTGATALFGTDLITPPPPPPRTEPPPPPPPPEAPIRATGFEVDIEDAGQFNLADVDGRMTRVTPAQYRQRLIEELTALVPTLAGFRARWLVATERMEMLRELAEKGLIPDRLRTEAHLEAYDEFDLLAALAYGIQPLTRAERAANFGDHGPEWLVQLPQPTAKVIRAIVRQFERAGTAALETIEIWNTPELRELKGQAVLKQTGQQAQLLRKTKETLFAA